MKLTIPARPSSESIRVHPCKPFLKQSTPSYALSELKKDVEQELLLYPESEREALRSATQFGIFVVHNKLKPKLAELSAGTW